MPDKLLACDLLIRNAAQLCTVPPQGAADRLGPIANGAVAGHDGRIVWAGADEDVATALAPVPGCEVIDAAGCTVTPGLIDPHAHLPHIGSRAKEFRLRLEGVPYLEILARGGGILETVRAVAAAGDEDLVAAARADLDAMLLGGATTVEAKSGYGLTTQAELRLVRLAVEAGRGHPVEVVPTFLGAHAVPPPYKGKAEDYVELVVAEMLPAARPLAEFCDVFCEPGVFSVAQSRRILDRAARLGFDLKLHADEMAAGGGAELAAELGAASADHLLFASPAGLAAMAQAGTVAVLLPVTVLALLGDEVTVDHCRRQAEVIRRSGATIALGTDYNPGTAPCRSMQLAMSLACRVFGLAPGEAIVGATRHAALALRRGDRLGSIVPGYQADLAIWRVADHQEIPYRLGDNLVRDVIKAGRVVVRDAVLQHERWPRQ